MIRLLIVILAFCWSVFPVSAQDSAAQPIVKAELTEESILVGQPVILRVTVLVPTWMPKPPVFPSFEVPNLIVKLPQRASGPVSETIEGETWSGVSRSYRLYPMIPGPFSLPAQEIQVTYADPGDSSPQNIALPVPAATFTATVPEGAEALDPLIIAENVTLKQEIEGPEQTLSEGDSLIRTVTAQIRGSSVLFLPEIIHPVDAPSVQAYPAEPKVSESEDRGILSGTREEKTTYVARYGGPLELPEITLDWFNTKTGKIETATLTGAIYEIDAPAAPRAPLLTSRQMAALIILLALSGLVVWAIHRWLLPPLKEFIQTQRDQYLVSERYAAKQVHRAIAAQDLSAVSTALHRWEHHLPSHEEPYQDQLHQSLLAIGRALYREGHSADWGAFDRTFVATRKARRAAQGAHETASALPPLNPY